MTIRRKSTYAWSLKHAADNPDIAAALDRAQMRDILDTIDAHRASIFVIRTVPQVFKTLIGQLRAMRCRQVEPRPTLWYRESIDTLKGFAAEKFNPLFDACAPLPPLLFRDRNRRTTLHTSFPDGTYTALLSAGVDGNRQSKTACDIYLDEPWLYGPGWIGQIQKRHDAYPYDFREIDMSTGATADTEADQRWSACDQRTWHCRCPNKDCDKLFFPARTHKHPTTGAFLGGLVYQTLLTADGKPDKAAISASVVYQCPHCGSRHPNTDATRLAFSGTARAPRGAYVVLNPAAAPRHFGWHIHHIALKDWAPLAVKMVESELARSRGDYSVLEEIVRLYDAGTWDPALYHRPEKFSRYPHPTPYKLRELWADEITDAAGRPMRTATVDVQLDYYVLVIRKWGRFSASRLHFVAICYSPGEIARICQEELVPPVRVAFDTRHDSQRVRTVCARMGWRTMMGDKAERDYPHPDGIRRIYQEVKDVDAFTGTVHQGASGSTVRETLFSKNSALNRLDALRSDESKAPDGSPLWTAAEDAPDWYFRQINAHYRKRVDNADGSHHYVWHGQKDDHAGDCEAMAVVMATALGLTGKETLTPPTST